MFSQNSITPTVIGSSGSEKQAGSSGNYIQFTLGESFITTQTGQNNMLTQGFHQPTKESILNVTPLFVSFSITDASCYGLFDGIISIDSLSGCGSSYIVKLDGEDVDSLVMDSLAEGFYNIEITSNLNCLFDTTITINSLGDDCDLEFYNAISPNGDNVNDSWTIVKIETDPNNSVQIFSRWGTLVWSAEGYNNKDIVWGGTNQNGKDLPDGTYYYVINADGKVHNGYVEITR